MYKLYKINELVKTQNLRNNAQQDGRPFASKRPKKNTDKEILKGFSEKGKQFLPYQVDQDELIKSTLLSDSTKTSQIEMTSLQQPSWTGCYKECVHLLEQVENLQNEIVKQKIKKLSSISQKKHDIVIQKFVDEATIKLNKCQKKLKQLEIQASYDQDTNSTGKKTFTSMMMAMASNIREQARKLRGHQQSQLHRQRQLKMYDKNILDGAGMQTSETQSWLSEEDFEMLEKNMEKERNQQINKIVQSITSLNTIYKDLQALVIEQGSLLDRIDENIDHTVESVKKANEHLQEANKKAESSCFTKLRLFLIIVIAALFTMFILKHS